MSNYDLNDIKERIENRETWEEIAIACNSTVSATKRAYYRMKKKAEEELELELDMKYNADEISEIGLIDTSEPLYAKNHHYDEVRPLTEGDLFNIIKDALKGEIDIDSELLERMKKGYPKMPFGGEKTVSGGWNSITYAVFEVIERSNRFYIKKE